MLQINQQFQTEKRNSLLHILLPIQQITISSIYIAKKN